MEIKAMFTAALVAVTMALLVSALPAAASQTDERIEATAKESYVFNTYLKGDDIKIRSVDGIVYLTGTVSEDFHKSMAEDTLMYMPGVKSVDNRLIVTGERPAEKSDAWLSAKVKTTLLFHRNVSSMTKVNTKDGIVTLQGEASSQAQKDLTAEYAGDVEGVKDVKNDMKVSMSAKKTDRTAREKIDDASITAQVKMSLLMHRSTSALHTGVTTKSGVVTLSGEAGNSAEKSLVTKLVNDINGVKSVNNRMTIIASK